MGLGLDLSKVDAGGNEFTPVPDGIYECFVEKAEVTSTKTGGERIKVQYSIRGPSHEGRKIFDSFNIRNSSAKAVEIGLSRIKELKIMGGAENPNRLESAQELVGLNVAVRIKNETSPEYGVQARVQGVFAITGTKFTDTTDAMTEFEKF